MTNNILWRNVGLLSVVLGLHLSDHHVARDFCFVPQPWKLQLINVILAYICCVYCHNQDIHSRSANTNYHALSQWTAKAPYCVLHGSGRVVSCLLSTNVYYSCFRLFEQIYTPCSSRSNFVTEHAFPQWGSSKYDKQHIMAKCGPVKRRLGPASI